MLFMKIIFELPECLLVHLLCYIVMNLKAVTADANSDNVFVSESAGSCERDQQSTVQQPDGKANYTFTPYCK